MNRTLAKLLHFSQSIPLASKASAPNWANNFARARKIMADLFAFPTQYREGIPRVLLEAGLSGLPIVASRMPGCNDVVEDGWNGYLVAPRDADGLASRIVDLLSDRARGKVMAAVKSQHPVENFPGSTRHDRIWSDGGGLRPDP